MLKNFFLVSLRLLLKNRLYTFINVAGLAVGLSLVIMLFLFVYNEFNYNLFNSNYERIYRLEGARWTVTPAVAAEEILPKCVEVEKCLRINFNGSIVVDVGRGPEMVENWDFTDSTFFDIFSFKLLIGDPSKALSRPMSVVLSKELATKLFGGIDQAVGKTIRVRNQTDFLVTGVLDEYPANSSIKPNALASMVSLPALHKDPDVLKNRNNWNYHTFLLANRGTNLDTLYKKIDVEVRHLYNISDTVTEEIFKITPLKELYFKNMEHHDNIKHGNKRFVIIYLAIAIFILVIACINFINLSTARSMRRAREVGVKKVLGAHQGQLIFQFLFESFLLTTIALLIAFGITEFSLPVFNELLQTQLTVPYSGLLFLYVFFGAFVVSLLSGIFPAYIFSKLKPVGMLKGSFSRGNTGIALRRSLMVFQFSIAVILIIITGIVYLQMQHMRNLDLGFNKEQVMYFWVPQSKQVNISSFKTDLMQNPNIIKVGRSGAIPGNTGMSWGRNIKGEEQYFSVILGDKDFVDLLGIEIIEGRNLENTASDSNSAILFNQTAVRELGLDTVMGYKINIDDTHNGKVVGVMKDFHFESAHKRISPMAIVFLPAWSMDLVSVKLNTSNIQETIEFIERKFFDFFPDKVFHYEFVDKTFDELYKSEERLARVFGYFSFFALVIAMLGLFGLATFMAEQRTREIGIRKSYGASVKDIVLLLSADFSRWILLANLIAWPLAWYFGTMWLQKFPYSIGISWVLFAVATILVLVVSWLTIFWKSYFVALANPADVLRYE